MRRALLRLLGVAFFTWLEFAVFPGHSFLKSGTQLTVPMIERLANPGFLSRDLVATHPNLEYTAYDEITLFLNEATGINLERSLAVQQLITRAAGLLGILLLAISAGIPELLSLAIAALVNLGAFVAGPRIMLVDPEPVPYTLAWGLILLAIGLLSREKPLLAALAGGVALIYQPFVTAPLWLLILLLILFDRNLRRLLRPTIPVLAVFVLLLANFAQLQPGIAEQQSTFGKIPEAYIALQKFRTPHEYVSLWRAGEIWSYLAIWIVGIWAVARISPVLNRQVRWFFVALPACGILSLLLSFLLLDRLHLSLVPHVRPVLWILFTICLSLIACFVASARATRNRNPWEGALWFALPILVIVRTEFLDLFRVIDYAATLRLLVAIAFVLGAVYLIKLTLKRLSALTLAIPLLAIAILLTTSKFTIDRAPDTAVLSLADWVKQNTWGSSMFLFPDLDRNGDPGLFRGRSERALWVDWNSGSLVPCFESFAAIWWERWHNTMQPGYSTQQLQADLELPIDYYVLKTTNRLSGIKPVFANDEFLVYDANDLRNAPGPLRAAATPP
jgi:hypothetical protein